MERKSTRQTIGTSRENEGDVQKMRYGSQGNDLYDFRLIKSPHCRQQHHLDWLRTTCWIMGNVSSSLEVISSGLKPESPLNPNRLEMFEINGDTWDFNWGKQCRKMILNQMYFYKENEIKQNIKISKLVKLNVIPALWLYRLLIFLNFGFSLFSHRGDIWHSTVFYIFSLI